MRVLEACEILGVNRSDEDSKIRNAYKKLALRFHPDKCKASDRESATMNFQRISKAYKVMQFWKKNGREYDSDDDSDNFDPGMEREMDEVFEAMMIFETMMKQMGMQSVSGMKMNMRPGMAGMGGPFFGASFFPGGRPGGGAGAGTLMFAKPNLRCLIPLSFSVH